jgi:hypothetical protein
VEERKVQPLRHVLWIGGPPGTGKTAVATRIARRHGLRWYGADTRTWEHRDRALGAGNAAARRWEAMTPLLREANEAIVAQVRGDHARPWAEGDAESVVREFLCECGSTTCHASVPVPVAAPMAGPVLAPRHR